jgi:PilZ domain
MDMRLVPEREGRDKVERLAAELKAIQQWDVLYWRSRTPETYEKSAFVARCNRRNEILAQLVNMEKGPVDLQESKPNDTNERRRHRRLDFETEMRIRLATGLVPGETLDISESGMSAILPFELQVGDVVELTIKLPIALATARAVVRTRNMLRHGFEFLQPLRDTIPREASSDDCQTCGGTGLIVQPTETRRGVAFMRVRCPRCDGLGRGTGRTT